MKKSLSKKIVILPLPVYIIATYDEHGVANAMNVAWGMQSDYFGITFILDKNHKTTSNIEKKGAFTVSLATRKTEIIADYFGIESGNKVDKIKKSGVTAVRSKNVDAPVIEEFPLTLECKVKSITEENGDIRVVGEIVNTLIEEEYLDEEGKVDVDKLEFITFDSVTNSYRLLGEKVGSAFKDGLKLK